MLHRSVRQALCGAGELPPPPPPVAKLDHIDVSADWAADPVALSAANR
jgi:hypothetical protein